MLHLLLSIFLLTSLPTLLLAQEEGVPELSLIEDEIDSSMDQEGLWLELKSFSSFDDDMNELIKKRVMQASTRQTQYRLVLPDKRVTSDEAKLKKTTKKVTLNITSQGASSYKIEAQLIDQKDKSVIRRVSRSFVAEKDVLLMVEKATLLLFFDKVVSAEDKSDTKKAPRSRPNEASPLDKAAIDFREEVRSLKNEISLKFNQIKQEELKKDLAQSKDQNDEDKKNENNNAQGMSVAQAKTMDNANAQEMPSIVAPRNRILTQFGLMSQDYLIQENASTANEIEIRTTVQFVYMQAETMRQLFNSQLDWIAGVKFSQPLSKAEVPIKKYTNLRLGLHYGLFADTSFPLGLSSFVIRDNLSFANVPVAGQGLKTSEVSTTWLGGRIALGAWEKRLALWFDYHSLMSFSAEEGTFGNESMMATRFELSLLYDTGWIINNTLASLNYQSLSFTSEGTRQVNGTNNSLVVSLGYLF